MYGIKTISLGSICFCWLEQPEVRHYFNSQYTGFVQSLEFFYKGMKFRHQFSRPGKMVKSLEFFFVQIYIKCIISENFLLLVKSYSISPMRLQRVMATKIIELRNTM